LEALMLGLVQSWFAPTGNPIGVDFGTDGLRMAQVEAADGEYRLVAAASAEVPAQIRQDPTARLNFFTETVRDRLASGNFRGKRAILSLPAASCFIQHLRMPRLEEEELKKALPWEARGKLPIDPTHALLRHIVAGEVYQDSEQKNEVILMAAARELVNQLLGAAAKAKLDVVGMNVEPKALVDCFTNIYRRKSDADQTTCYVDIGCSGTRAVIARGPQILFARAIQVGGDHFNRAVASALKMSLEDAKVLRIKVCSLGAPAPVAAGTVAPEAQQRHAAPQQIDQAFPLLGAGMMKAGATATAASPAVARAHAPAHAPAQQQVVYADPVSAELMEKARQVEHACREALSKLTEELDLCRRYHESTFSTRPIDRLVFVGGEARHRNLCQQIARQMSLAAQVGDPMVRMGRTSDVGVESGIDRRQPQPSWAVAIGLSMGPSDGTVVEGKK
jgi:type IV pilus assembly protein PilM